MIRIFKGIYFAFLDYWGPRVVTFTARMGDPDSGVGVMPGVDSIFEPTYAHARWALMYHFASVIGPKFTG